ncbi:MAG: hypothetical protein KF832_31425 [Caldilineaceae bacterium]|nr:hypothetical protein [Caldilineaceae bacterium]
MPQQPTWTNQWSYFASWHDGLFALVSVLSIGLLIIWWRQQTLQWFRVTMGALLLALVMSISSYYLFVVPVYFAGCRAGCPGWRGYPQPIAQINVDGSVQLAFLDFALNTLWLWLLWLLAFLLWRLLAIAFQWEKRSRQTRLLFLFSVVLLPWALLPRLLTPPQPTITGEELRLTTNAGRAAEFTYRITGLWVQRLAVEDVKLLQGEDEANLETVNRVGSQVCLRGYIYFFIPWQRYRIDLDGIGRTALRLTELPLSQPCW